MLWWGLCVCKNELKPGGWGHNWLQPAPLQAWLRCKMPWNYLRLCFIHVQASLRPLPVNPSLTTLRLFVHSSHIPFVLVLNQALFFWAQATSDKVAPVMVRLIWNAPPPISFFFYSTSQTFPFFCSGWLLHLSTWGQNGGAAAVCRAVLFLIDDSWHFLPHSSVCVGATSSLFPLWLRYVVFQKQTCVCIQLKMLSWGLGEILVNACQCCSVCSSFLCMGG